MLSAFQNAIRIPDLRRRLLVTFGLLILYRLGIYITLPGVDGALITEQLKGSKGGGGGLAHLMQFASMVTGGSMAQCTLFALGIMPYISASIIFSLLVKVIPQLEALSKEGEGGRRVITQYTRYATVGLCIVQSFFIVGWLQTPLGDRSMIIGEPGLWFWFRTVLALTTGTVFLMWIGEQITEFGIGNGISLIIMAGIIAALPPSIFQFFKNMQVAAAAGTNVPAEALKFLAFIGLFIIVTIAVVIMQLGQRRIPVQQAKHTRGRRVYGGQRHFLPLKVNSAGVMPVIFAQSLIVLPTAVFSAFNWRWITDLLSSPQGFWYITLQVLLVFFFTYFWTSLTFNPVEMAANMKEHGSFIPGIRPGRKTADYLEHIMNRITLVGSAFLAAITIFPTLAAGGLGINFMLASFLGGTGILIVVGVALDVVQKIESHLLMRHYEGFMKAGKTKGRRS
jgi:preprotein translocase subunit SecY